MAVLSKKVNKVDNVSAHNDVEVKEGFEPANVKNSIIVYRKKSTFKGATENDFWYSGTRADGHSVILKFKFELPEEFKNQSAFVVSNIVGNFKKKEETVKGETYTNFTYYVNECDFEEIEGEPLPL